MNTAPGIWLSMLRVVCSCLLIVAVGSAQAQSWVPFQAEWKRFVGAADASALNQPLGPADAISVQGAHFKRVGPDLKPSTGDDSRVRLFGVSLSGAAAFPAVEQAKEVAQTLRSLGFNAVRLHSLDVSPTSDPSRFQSTLTLGPYPTLHEGAIARLRHFIQVLGSEGIYVNLSLMVGYQFRPTADGIPALKEGQVGPGYGSPAHVFHPALIDKQVQYAKLLIDALNLRNYHGLAQVELINESSLSNTWLEWNPKKWDELIQGPYAQELHQQWLAWLRKRYGNEQMACQQWATASCGVNDLQLVSPQHAQLLLTGSNSKLWQRLKEKLTVLQQQVAQTKNRDLLAGIPPQILDTLRFITETDRAYLEHMKTVVRGVTRSNLPIAGGQANFGAPLAMMAQQGMDYVDTHFYVGHPEFPGASWSDSDWRFRDRAMSGGELSPLLDLTAYRDPNRPFVVSEFNQPYPATWGHEIIPITAAFAALQDWDGLYFFDYALAHDQRVAPHNFNLKGDWPKVIQIGLAAKMFRLNTLSPLPGIVNLPAPQEVMWFSAATVRRPDGWEHYVRDVLSPKWAPSNAGGYLALDSRLAIHSSSSTGSSAIAVDPEPAFKFDAEQKAVTIATATDLVVLRPNSRRTELVLGTLTIKNSMPDQPVAIWTHALDGKKIEQSRHILIAMPTPLVGSLPDSKPPMPVRVIPYQNEAEWKTLEPSASRKNSARSTSRTAIEPLWIKREPRTISLVNSAKTFEVYPLSPTGVRLPALRSPFIKSEANRHTLQVHAIPNQTHMWFEWVAQ